MRNIGPFLGPVTALDPGSIRDENAQDVLNVRYEDGKLRPRLGYESLIDVTDGHTAAWGAEYLQGYSGVDSVEEYVTIENDGQAVRPFAREWNGKDVREITSAGQRVDLAVGAKADGGWKAAVFSGDSYWFNPNDRDGGNVYRHEVGNTNSWELLQVPDAPTTRLVPKITLAGNTTSYPQYSFLGLDPTNAGDVACTGLAINAGSFLDTTYQIHLLHNNYTGTAGSECTVIIDLNECTAGVADWSYNDIIAFSLASHVGRIMLDPASIEVYLINNDSSPINLNPKNIERGFSSTPETNQWTIRADFSGKERLNWDNIRKIVLKYRVTGTNSKVALNELVIAKPVLGGVDLLGGWPSYQTYGRVLGFGYTHYYSGARYESPIGGMAFVDRATLNRDIYKVYTYSNLGHWITLTGTASADASVDQMRFYVDAPGGWRRIASVHETNTTNYRLTFDEVDALDKYSVTTASFNNMVCATPMKGWMVWGARGGYSNIRHSFVGEPERLASSEDINYEERGQDFTLADNQADEPQAMHAVGNALIILGKNGAHAQIVPGKPYTATPPKRLPGSFGVANRFASAVWRDDSGNPGVVWLSRHGDGVYFASVREDFNAESGFAIYEVTAPIRGSVREFLMDGQRDLWRALNIRTDEEMLAHARIGVDEGRDALWVVMGKRAMVLRRPSLVDGKRYWEFYEYNTGGSTVTIKHLAFSNRRMLRWLRSDAHFDGVEWHQSLDPIHRRRGNQRSTSYDNDHPVEGSYRDAGNRMPDGFWHSKTFAGKNRRILRCQIVKDDSEDQPTLRVYSTRHDSDELTFERTVVRPGILAEGIEHSFKIGVTETMDAITGFLWEEAPLGQRVVS